MTKFLNFPLIHRVCKFPQNFLSNVPTDILQIVSLCFPFTFPNSLPPGLAPLTVLTLSVICSGSAPSCQRVGTGGSGLVTL